MKIIDKIRRVIRGVMGEVAMLINEVSGGRIKPNHITLASLVLHGFVALAILNNQLVEAGVMLIFFGLMDAVDGALARLQDDVTEVGGYYDFVADRVKEVVVYGAIAYWLAGDVGFIGAVVAVLALGGSSVTTHVKTKGESIVRRLDADISSTKLNKLFSAGLMRFEVRMFLLVVTLLSGYVYEGVVLIAALSWWTAFEQLLSVSVYIKKKSKTT